MGVASIFLGADLDRLPNVDKHLQRADATLRKERNRFY